MSNVRRFPGPGLLVASQGLAKVLAKVLAKAIDGALD
jgi:hypothetical protein